MKLFLLTVIFFKAANILLFSVWNGSTFVHFMFLCFPCATGRGGGNVCSCSFFVQVKFSENLNNLIAFPTGSFD